MNTDCITKFAELPLEERAKVEEMTRDMLQSIVSGITPKYEPRQLPLVMFTTMYIDESGFVETTGGTAKSVMAGFSNCKLTEKGMEYLAHTNQD